MEQKTKKTLIQEAVYMDRNGMNKQENSDFDLFCKEVRKRNGEGVSITKTVEGCRYDAVVDGFILIEFKRRNYKSTDFDEYWMNTQKINFLRRSTLKGKKCYGVLFFDDKWFMFPVTEDETEFKYAGWKKVMNPMQGYTTEENYAIKPEQGKFYSYIA